MELTGKLPVDRELGRARRGRELVSAGPSAGPRWRPPRWSTQRLLLASSLTWRPSALQTGLRAVAQREGTSSSLVLFSLPL